MKVSFCVYAGISCLSILCKDRKRIIAVTFGSALLVFGCQGKDLPKAQFGCDTLKNEALHGSHDVRPGTGCGRFRARPWASTSMV